MNKTFALFGLILLTGCSLPEVKLHPMTRRAVLYDNKGSYQVGTLVVESSGEYFITITKDAFTKILLTDEQKRHLLVEP